MTLKNKVLILRPSLPTPPPRKKGPFFLEPETEIQFSVCHLLLTLTDPLQNQKKKRLKMQHMQYLQIFLNSLRNK